MMNSGAEKLKLYSYWSSSCAHRVKIALPLKGLDYEYKPVNLLKGTCLKKKFRSFKVTGESTKNNNSFIRDSMTTNSGAEKLKLYSYWSSSCANRVRIALALKGLDYEYIPVNLLKGDQVHPDFKKINPMGAVPALVDGDVVINDSFAIIMYLDEKYPEPPLLPRDLHKRAINYQAMSIVLSGIQPHKNLATVRFLEEKINAEEKTSLINDAVTKGFAALEKLLVNCAGKHATGDDIYLADLFLAPQIYWTINKFQMNMDPYPTLKKCHESYNELPAFQNAVPEKQPDAPSSTV